MDNPEKLLAQDTQDEENQNKNNTICVEHHYAQTNTSKTCALLQKTGDKDEPNINFMQKSKRTPQYGTHNVKTHNRTTQKQNR